MNVLNKIAISLMLCAGLSSSFAAQDTHDDPSRTELAVGGAYSTGGSGVLTTNFASLFGESKENAVAIELGLGKEEGRINLTYGLKFNDNHFVKITDDLLYQRSDFDFDFMTYTANVWQNSVGVGYKYAVNGSLLDSIEMSGYYVYAPSKGELSHDALSYSEFYAAPGESDKFVKLTNYARLAGSKISHAKLGLTSSPWDRATLTVSGDYEYINRDYLYSANKVSHQIGFDASFEQVLFSRMKVSAHTEHMGLSQSYGGSVSAILPSPRGVSLELVGNVSYDKNKITDSNDHSIGAAFRVGLFNTLKSYDISSESESFLSWTSTPVVRMSEVMVSKEEVVGYKAYAADIREHIIVLSEQEVRGITDHNGRFHNWSYISYDAFKNSEAKFKEATLDKKERSIYATFVDKSGNELHLFYIILRSREAVVNTDSWKSTGVGSYRCTVSPESCSVDAITLK